MSEPTGNGPRPRRKRPEGEVRPKGAHNTGEDVAEKKRPIGGSRAPRREDRPARGREDRPARGREDRPSRNRRDESSPRRDESRRSSRGNRDSRGDDASSGRPRIARPEGWRSNDRPARTPRRDDARAPRRDDARAPRRDDARAPRTSRAPRRDDARAPRRDDARAPRTSRAPRRDDARAPRRDEARAPRRDDARAPRTSRAPRRDDRPSGQWQSRPRPVSDRPSRGAKKGPRRDAGKPVRPQTAREVKSLEVKRRTGGRRTTDAPTGAANHVDELWIDEGSVRPARARKRARTSDKVSRGGTRAVKAMSPVVAEFEKSFGSAGAAKYLRRYEVALQAFEEHRYTEARIILTPLARECSDVGAVRELHALCLYREDSWHKAIIEFEAVIELDPTNVFNHAVLADCHRAVGEHDRVDELWTALRAASPNPELLAEGRIVYAGSLADRGQIEDAILVMTKVPAAPKKVREYHLREWYMLANLLDKAGDVVKARNVFEQIAAVDSGFADVAERLSTLGS